MNYAIGTSTPVSLGIKTWTIGFQAKKVIFTVTVGSGASAIDFSSVGKTNGSITITDSSTTEATRVFKQRFSDRLCSIHEWNGSSWVETFRVNFDSITATEVKYNVVTLTTAYQILREAEA